LIAKDDTGAQQRQVQAVVNALQLPSSVGQTYEAVGPEVLTLRQIVQLAGQITGHPRPVIGLPWSLGKLQAWLMECAPGEPLMSRDNIDSMQIDNVASGRWPELAALGISPASVRAVAPGYLAARGVRSALGDMRKSAGRY
jgi:uncharacterized protein YbjT (DUF2867 family)